MVLPDAHDAFPHRRIDRPERVSADGRLRRPGHHGAFPAEFFIFLNRRSREAVGCTAGDDVEVTLRLDEHLRVITPPGDLVGALAGAPLARDTFEHLSYSHQREYVHWIEEAKRPETRQRRISKALEMLLGSKTQR